MKRIFAMLLAAVMVVGMFPSAAVHVHATEAEEVPVVETAPEETTLPVEEAPAEETTEPVTEATDPVEETTAPTTEVTEPVTEATEPVTEETEPVTEETEPVTEATEPVTEATEPATPEIEAVQVQSSAQLAADNTCGENVTWELTNGVLTIYGSGDMYDYSGVASVPWYEDRYKVKEVVVEEGITAIGTHAFYQMGQLERVTIAESVTQINLGAFQDCTALKSIRIPDSVTNIGDWVFSGCCGLKSITLPQQATTLGDCVFSNCSNLVSVKLPEGIDKVGGYMFNDCSSLISVTIPGSVTFIDGGAFQGCSKLWHVLYTGTQAQWEALTVGATNSCFSQATGHFGATGNEVTESNKQYCTKKEQYACGYCGAVYFDPNYSGKHTYVDGICSGCQLPETIKYSLSDSGAVITNYSGTESKLTIPGTIEGRPVTEIGNKAFDNCTGLTEIVLPDSVTSIGASAFYGCSSLVSITIPESVTSIGTSAFASCTSLISIDLPEGVESIAEYTFNDCSSLKSITIPASLTSIKNYAFNGCGSLTDIYISDVLSWLNITFNANPLLATNEGKNLYLDGELIKDLVIPEGATAIPDSAFRFCKELTSVTIPQSVGSIGSAAFAECTGLTSVAIPEGVTVIGGGAFENCGNLVSVTIAEGVTKIDFYAFRNCGNLTDITLPETLKSIGFSAFENCGKLRGIKFPDALETIGSSAFKKCKSLEYISIPDGVTALYGNTFEECTGVRWVFIPASVTAIGSFAFYRFPGGGWDHIYYSGTEEQWKAIKNDGANFSGKETIHFNAKSDACIVYDEQTCTTKALYKCTICEKIFYDTTFSGTHDFVDGVCTVCGEVNYIASGTCGDYISYTLTESGHLKFTGTGPMTQGPGLNQSAQVKTIEIGEGITTIANNAFRDYGNLISVQLPAGMTTIGTHAFIGCKNLQSVVIPEGVTTIGSHAFDGCSSLTSVTIPRSLSSLGYTVFYGCSNLQEVHISDLAAWASITYADSNSNPLKNGAALFLNGIKLTELNIPEGVTTIGDYAFYGMKDTTSVTVPGSVTTFGKYAFGYNQSMTSLTLGEGITVIGEGAFENCTALTSVDIPDCVTTIGTYAFAGCSSLKTAIISDSVTTIERYAFHDCQNLRNLYIGKGVKIIDECAFGNCGRVHCVFYDGTIAEQKKIKIIDNGHLMEATWHSTMTCCVPEASCYFDGELGKPIVKMDYLRCYDSWRIYRSDSIEGEYQLIAQTDEVRYLDEVALEETIYYYKIVGVSFFGVESEAKYDATPTVVDVDTDMVTGKPDICWVDRAGAKRYDVYRAEEEDGTYTKIKGVKGTKYKDLLTDVGKTYYYKIKVIGEKASYDSEFSLAKSGVAICARPEVSIKISTDTGTPVLTWKAVSGAVSYEIYRAATDGEYELLSDQPELNYSDLTAVPDTVYYYRVRAIAENPLWNSMDDDGEKIHTTLAKPDVDFSVDDVSGKAVLEWDAVEGAVGYEVHRSTSASKSYKAIATLGTTETRYEDASATVGKSYYYKVIAIGENSESVFSAYKKLTSKCAQPDVEGQVDGGSGKPVLTWEKISGAKKYTVYSVSAEGKLKSLGTTTKLTFTHTKAVVGTEYTYVVKANGSESAYHSINSETVKGQCVCARPAVTVTIDSTTGKPVLSWKAVTGAVSYDIYRAGAADGEFEKLHSQAELKYTDEAAAPDTACCYKVVAIGTEEAFNSQDGAVKETRSTLAKPVVTFNIMDDSGKPILEWDAVPGTKGYEVYRSTKATKSYKLVAELEAGQLVFEDVDAAVGKGYYYKVKAIGTESQSVFSAYKKLTAKCGQPVVSATTDAASGKPVLTWEKISGAKKYTVYSVSAEGKLKSLGTTTKLTFTHTKAVVGTTYTYVVKANASKSSYNSINSAEVTCLTICAQPAVTVKLEAATGKPVVSWKAVSGAVRYELWRRGNGGEYELVPVDGAMTYTDVNAVIDGPYDYMVKAIAAEEAWNSAYGNEVSIYAACAAPKITGSLNGKKPMVSWESVDGAVSYTVYRSTKKSSGYKAIAEEVTENSYTDATAKKGKTYYYKVVAVSENTESAMSNYAKLKSK